MLDTLQNLDFTSTFTIEFNPLVKLVTILANVPYVDTIDPQADIVDCISLQAEFTSLLHLVTLSAFALELV